jgi:hypothetical protein
VTLYLLRGEASEDEETKAEVHCCCSDRALVEPARNIVASQTQVDTAVRKAQPRASGRGLPGRVRHAPRKASNAQTWGVQ